jgi:hypothetical protein
LDTRWRLFGAALLIAVAWLFAPALGLGFRSEDFVDFEYYSRATLAQVLGGTHLGMEMLHFWRPLADLVTWLLVRVVGPHAWPIHFVLLLLLVATAVAAGQALRRTFGLSVGAAWAAALLVVVHPFAPAVLTYFDGGVPTLLAGLFTMLALAELGRWRDGNARGKTLLLACSGAAFSYDLGLLVPLLLCVVAWLLPRSERRVPWFLLLLIPAVVALRVVLGVGYRGYSVQPDREMVVLFVPRVATVVGRLFAPVFAGELHPEQALLAVLVILGGVVAAAVAIAIAARHASAWTAVRQAAALAVLTIGLVGFAPDLVLLNRTASGIPARPDELTLAYKTWPAATAAMLATAWLFGRASGRRWWGSLALALPWAVTLLVLRAPIGAAHEEALVWAQGICDGVAAQATKSGAQRLIVFDIPVANRRGGHEPARTVTRVLQYGLGAAQRPPCRAPGVAAYPVFRAIDGMGTLATRETLDAIAASPWLLPLRCRTAPDVAVVPIERPVTPAGPGSLRLFADADGRERVFAADLADAPIVPVANDGSIELFTSGEAPGDLQLFVLNRLHPVFVKHPDQPPGSTPPPMDLVRTPPPAGGVDRLSARVAWLAELATRYAADVVFLVLESRPDAARTPATVLPATVSNVLPVRLRRADARGR